MSESRLDPDERQEFRHMSMKTAEMLAIFYDAFRAEDLPKEIVHELTIHLGMQMLTPSSGVDAMFIAMAEATKRRMDEEEED